MPSQEYMSHTVQTSDHRISRTGVAVEDCADLLSAVMQRLAATAIVGSAMPEAIHDGNHLGKLECFGVSDCVSALHQLHCTMLDEIARLQGQNLDILNLRATLARAQLDLAGLRSSRQSSVLTHASGIEQMILFTAQAI